jgi:hypothetical protein
VISNACDCSVCHVCPLRSRYVDTDKRLKAWIYKYVLNIAKVSGSDAYDLYSGGIHFESRQRHSAIVDEIGVGLQTRSPTIRSISLQITIH